MKESLYTDISERINLQSIGYLIREGALAVGESIEHKSFEERAFDAGEELDKKIKEHFPEIKDQILLWAIIGKYTDTKECVAFSLGMKTGAKLALLLTSDFEKDY